MATRQDTGSNSPWRILLSIGILIFTLIRVVATCSRTSQPVESSMPELEEFEQRQHDMIARQLVLQKKVSNEMMYTDFKALEKLDGHTLRRYGIRKIEKDSIIHFDLSADLKLEHDTYYQNNSDDSLKMAIRTPETSIFFHDFPSRQDDEVNLKSIKRGLHPEHFKVDKVGRKMKAYHYTLTKNSKKINGYAIVLGKNDYAFYAEFESSTLSKFALQTKALLYIITHVKAPSNN